MFFDPGDLQRCSLAKYAAAFFNRSCSSVNRVIGRFLSSAASILRKDGHRFARFCFAPWAGCICWPRWVTYGDLSLNPSLSGRSARSESIASFTEDSLNSALYIFAFFLIHFRHTSYSPSLSESALIIYALPL